MNYTKIVEGKLNNLDEIKSSIINSKELLKQNKSEIKSLEKALSELPELDRKLIQRICINKEGIKDLEDVFNIKQRQIYYLKNKALKKLTKRLYGINKMEGNGNGSKMQK